jgi:hypothetical protein
LLAYLAQVSVALVLCSGIFWGITCGSIAVSANLPKPTRHLVIGIFLQLLGFIIVGVIALLSQRKIVALRKELDQQKALSSPIVSVDEW